MLALWPLEVREQLYLRSIEGCAARGAALPGSRHVGRRPGAWLPLALFPLDDLDRLLKAAANTGPEVGVVHRRYSRAKSSSPRLIASEIGRASCRERVCQSV